MITGKAETMEYIKALSEQGIAVLPCHKDGKFRLKKTSTGRELGLFSVEEIKESLGNGFLVYNGKG